MRTYVHISFSLIVLLILYYFDFLNITWFGILMVVCAELIDLDHLFSKPIYHPLRNPFRTHFLHKRWYIIVIFAIVMMFLFSWGVYLGIGLLSHIFVDFIYVKINRIG